MIKKILLVAFLALLIGCGINFLIPATHAQSGPNVPVGWGWSSNIGWIKLTGYGFSIDTNTGVVGGYGWSPSIGWVDFSSARYFTATGQLKGYAHALTANTPEAGGWDGNISLYPASGSSYGINTNGGQLAGYAWGSDVVGWTYFNFPAPNGPPICSGNPPFSNCTCPSGGTPDINGQCGGGTPLSATCSGSVSGSNITWQASASGGTPGYHYSWSDDDGSIAGDSASILKTYTAPPSGSVTEHATVIVSDSATSPAQVTCQTSAIINAAQGCPNPNDPNDPACNLPPSLDVTPNNGLLAIFYSTQPADSEIENPPATDNPSGTRAAELTAKNGTINACIQSIKMQKSPNTPLADLVPSDQAPTCQFQKGYSSSAPFGPCINTCLILNAGDKAYFRIRVQKPLKVISTNNPYQIIIGNSPSGNTPTSKKLILDYLVATFVPI